MIDLFRRQANSESLKKLTNNNNNHVANNNMTRLWSEECHLIFYYIINQV